MNVGDRVELSARGKECDHIFPNPATTGVVVLPGTSRGGLYLRVLVDGEKQSRTFARDYWQLRRQP